jgi:hypothetical protein
MKTIFNNYILMYFGRSVSWEDGPNWVNFISGIKMMIEVAT